MIKKISLLLTFSAVLCACQQKNYNYDYLMTHPMAIRAALDYCQMAENRTESQSATCEQTAAAARDMQALITQEQQDPENFGQVILNKQMAYANTKIALAQAKAALANLQTTHAADPVIKAALDKMKDQQTQLSQLSNDIAYREAVLSLGTPD